MRLRPAKTTATLALFCAVLVTDRATAAIIYNGHLYDVTPTTGSWTDAEAYAVTQGGHLVTIDDAAENEFIRTTFLTISGPQEDFWIGLYSPAGPGDDPDSYGWVSGSTSPYRNWRVAQPDAGGGTDFYVAINFLLADDGHWDNYPDTGFRALRGIFELEPVVPEPSTLTLLLLGLLGLARRRK